VADAVSGSFNRLFAPLSERLKGPGGYYNAGNVLGLTVAVVTQFLIAAQAPGPHSGADILYAYFAGSPSALALTAATLVFLVSGETYHRAWSGRALPDPTLNRIADILSAVGAIALTASLFFVGQWLLAAASGLLTVGGKFGSALFGDDRSQIGFWPALWVDPFRAAVLVGRVPGVAAAVIDLGFRLLYWTGGSPLGLVQPAVLVVCYLLWIKADFLLVVGADVTKQSAEADNARPN
jgi:hypothetical protein